MENRYVDDKIIPMGLVFRVYERSLGNPEVALFSKAHAAINLT